MLTMDVVDSLREIDTIATEPSAREAAARLAAEAGAAARAGDLVLARDRQALLGAMLAELNLSCRIRIAQRAGEPSDTWRVPAANPRGRNFYLIVEAVRDDKQDDGIIENDTVGEKSAGELSRRWRAATPGQLPHRRQHRRRRVQDRRRVLSPARTVGARRSRYSSRCTFSIRSWRSCASIESVAIGRASSRFRLIGSPVSSQ